MSAQRNAEVAAILAAAGFGAEAERINVAKHNTADDAAIAKGERAS